MDELNGSANSSKIYSILLTVRSANASAMHLFSPLCRVVDISGISNCLEVSIDREGLAHC